MIEGHDLSPQLAEIRSQFDAVTEKAGALVKGLTAEQLKQRPEPNSWSVAECLAHLNITAKEYLPILDEALERARQQQPSVTSNYKLDIMGRLLKWSLEPPARFKFKTTKPFEPLDTEPINRLFPNFLSFQEELKSRLERGDSIAIDKIKVTSPFNERVKYNLFSAFNILVAHERRHIWQAEQVRKAIGA